MAGHAHRVRERTTFVVIYSSYANVTLRLGGPNFTGRNDYSNSREVDKKTPSKSKEVA